MTRYHTSLEKLNQLVNSVKSFSNSADVLLRGPSTSDITKAFETSFHDYWQKCTNTDIKELYSTGHPGILINSLLSSQLENYLAVFENRPHPEILKNIKQTSLNEVLDKTRELASHVKDWSYVYYNWQGAGQNYYEQSMQLIDSVNNITNSLSQKTGAFKKESDFDRLDRDLQKPPLRNMITSINPPSAMR